MRSMVLFFLMITVIIVPSVSFALSVGDRAPDFEAPSTHGNVILSEFQGKKNIVLAIYYADFTPV